MARKPTKKEYDNMIADEAKGAKKYDALGYKRMANDERRHKKTLREKKKQDYGTNKGR